MSDPVITVTSTLVDGQVVRWHTSVADAEISRPLVSASRAGVVVHAQYLTDVPDDWVSAAREAHDELARTRRADLRHLATHEHHGALNGPLRPVATRGED